MKSDEKRLNQIILEAAELKKSLNHDRPGFWSFLKAKPKAAEAAPISSLPHASKVNSKVAPAAGKATTFKQMKETLPEVQTGRVSEIKKGSGLSWWDRQKLKRNPETSYIISMEFSNGTTRDFVVATRDETFTYKGRTYYLRYEDARFDLSRNQYKLVFHEDHCLPLSRAIHRLPAAPGDKWGAALRNINSTNLKPLLSMEYIKILAENLISKLVKLILIVSILALLLGIITLVGVVKMGAFKGGG